MIDSLPLVVSLPIADRASILTPSGPQPWGYAGAFAGLVGHVWMIRTQVGW